MALRRSLNTTAAYPQHSTSNEGFSLKAFLKQRENQSFFSWEDLNGFTFAFPVKVSHWLLS